MAMSLCLQHCPGTAAQVLWGDPSSCQPPVLRLCVLLPAPRSSLIPASCAICLWSLIGIYRRFPGSYLTSTDLWVNIDRACINRGTRHQQTVAKSAACSPRKIL